MQKHKNIPDGIIERFGSLTDCLWDGLDLDQFEVIDILPQSKKYAAIIMRDRSTEGEGALYPWCVEFAGNGRYFQTFDDLIRYCAGRHFKGAITISIARM